MKAASFPEVKRKERLPHPTIFEIGVRSVRFARVSVQPDAPRIRLSATREVNGAARPNTKFITPFLALVRKIIFLIRVYGSIRNVDSKHNPHVWDWSDGRFHVPKKRLPFQLRPRVDAG